MEIIAILIVNLATSLVKKIQAIRFSPEKKFIVRFIAAFFSFATVIAMSLDTGIDVDPQAIEIFVESVLVFLGATGTYYMSKR